MPTLKQLVQQNIDKTVYGGTKGRSTQYQTQSNQWGEGQKAPKIEVRKGMRISGYNKTGNPMANGKMPTVNDVATSDRSIPLNSKIIVNGKKYNVGDRTAADITAKHGDTIDIFYDEPKSKTLQRGVSKKDVQIIKK